MVCNVSYQIFSVNINQDRHHMKTKHKVNPQRSNTHSLANSFLNLTVVKGAV